MANPMVFVPSPMDPWDQDAVAVVLALVTAELTETPVDMALFSDVRPRLVAVTAARLLAKFLVDHRGQYTALNVVHRMGVQTARRRYCDD